MPPNQGPPPSQNPYDFIINPVTPPQKPRIPLPIQPGGSKKTQFLLYGVIGVIVIMLLVIGFSIVGGSPDNPQQLLRIAQEQQEIIRVSNLATNQARTQQAINLSATASVTIASSQNDIVTIIGKKAKVNTKTLSLKKDVKTDQQLSSAAQNNQFDNAFIQQMQSHLTTYQNDVKNAYNDTKDSKAKTVLQNAYNGADTLLRSLSSSAQAPN